MPSSRGFKLVRLLDDDNIGREARAQSSDHSAVKLWLRLLSCSTQIEQEIRTRLRQRFATTLPRFDYLAQLERHREGLRMNALSRYLMVTGGNVTGLTDQLVAEGHVQRLADPTDRRSLIVRLTPAGRAQFLRMAAEHVHELEVAGGLHRLTSPQRCRPSAPSRARNSPPAATSRCGTAWARRCR